LPAHHIDEVVQNLDRIIGHSAAHQSRLGYFPALYRKVTLQVARKISEGQFEDGSRMERLDVLFANRYLDAFEVYRQGKAVPASWRIAFDASAEWWPIVLQHLLLGINAHINLDLAVAAAATCPGPSLPSLKNDFNRINSILASLVDDVKAELNAVWPLLGLLDRLSGRSEDVLINFSMTKARDCAWQAAERLAAASPEQQDNLVAQLDTRVAAIGRLVRRPGILAGATTRLIRLGERKSVREVIEILK
jgi:Family of unknown function (DUF5995)